MISDFDWTEVQIVLNNNEIIDSSTRGGKETYSFEKPLLVIKKLDNGRYAHKDFATTNEALDACSSQEILPGHLICVYNINWQQFVANEVIPDLATTHSIYTITAYYIK